MKKLILILLLVPTFCLAEAGGLNIPDPQSTTTHQVTEPDPNAPRTQGAFMILECEVPTTPLVHESVDVPCELGYNSQTQIEDYPPNR